MEISEKLKKISEETKEPVNKNWCIFEKKVCSLANNVNRSFECQAKSDEEMKCHKCC